MIEWLPVINYEGLYEVSNTGLVRSLSRNIISSNGVLKNLKSVLLKQWLTNGYLCVSLSKDCIVKKYRVHRIEMIAFKGISSLRDIDHGDGNKLNNNLWNLNYTTHRQNNTNECLKRKNKSSKYVGVHYDNSRSKWVSNIMVTGKVIRLGRFNTEIEAHESYQYKLSTLNDR